MVQTSNFVSRILKKKNEIEHFHPEPTKILRIEHQQKRLGK